MRLQSLVSGLDQGVRIAVCSLSRIQIETKMGDVASGDESGVIRKVVHHEREPLKTIFIGIAHMSEGILDFGLWIFGISLAGTIAGRLRMR